jgi:C1A family cysteine protease
VSQKSKLPGSNRYYGWRRQQPDRRDLRFAASRAVMESLPPAVDLTAGMGQVLDQGQLGSCGPNSSDSLVMFDQQKQGLSVGSVSRLFIYYTARQLMDTVSQDSGVDNRTMLKALHQYGFCDETLWPYNISAFTQQPPQSVYDAALANAISSYAVVAQDIDSIKGCIASGFPFLFGFTVLPAGTYDVVPQASHGATTYEAEPGA